MESEQYLKCQFINGYKLHKCIECATRLCVFFLAEWIKKSQSARMCLKFAISSVSTDLITDFRKSTVNPVVKYSPKYISFVHMHKRESNQPLESAYCMNESSLSHFVTLNSIFGAGFYSSAHIFVLKSIIANRSIHCFYFVELSHSFPFGKKSPDNFETNWIEKKRNMKLKTITCQRSWDARWHILHCHCLRYLSYAMR